MRFDSVCISAVDLAIFSDFSGDYQMLFVGYLPLVSINYRLSIPAQALSFLPFCDNFHRIIMMLFNECLR